MPTPEIYEELMMLSLSDDPKDREIATRAAANLTFEEKQRYFDFQQKAHQQSGTGRGAHSTETLRSDDNWIADQASKLPEPFQKPAAYVGSLAGQALELITDPTNVLGVMGGVSGAARATKAAAETPVAGSAVGRGIAKVVPAVLQPRQTAIEAAERMAYGPAERAAMKVSDEAARRQRVGLPPAVENRGGQLNVTPPRLEDELTSSVRGAQRELVEGGEDLIPPSAPGIPEVGLDPRLLSENRGGSLVRGGAGEEELMDAIEQIRRGDDVSLPPSQSRGVPSVGPGTVDEELRIMRRPGAASVEMTPVERLAQEVGPVSSHAPSAPTGSTRPLAPSRERLVVTPEERAAEIQQAIVDEMMARINRPGARRQGMDSANRAARKRPGKKR